MTVRLERDTKVVGSRFFRTRCTSVAYSIPPLATRPMAIYGKR